MFNSFFSGNWYVAVLGCRRLQNSTVDEQACLQTLKMMLSRDGSAESIHGNDAYYHRHHVPFSIRCWVCSCQSSNYFGRAVALGAYMLFVIFGEEEARTESYGSRRPPPSVMRYEAANFRTGETTQFARRDVTPPFERRS